MSRPLLLDDADDVLGGGWSGELGEIVATVETVNDEDGVIRVLRTDDGLVAALPGDPGDPGDPEDGSGLGNEEEKEGEDGDEAWTGPGPGRPVRRTGLLTVERHSAQWPETTGTVRTIHLVRQDFAETAPGSRTREPVPASRSLEAVDRSPKWFGEGLAGVLAELEPPDPST
ncbi:DUF6578 domain-containing protein [Streptomyces rhizosphaerihabitans]|uniref:DUF6578 domain-containing protein n=1 Tax=Streptomyces rhizosphaerihabitans TaxID=1266770 RepID=UPI0021BF9056|nr:DUF6578 domain-containing protein [Streptomyces rhizosphaerihabitans]MCT9011029.1 hypothetical protein [Streptomyces rhizosphaerihabitans]